MKRPLYLRRIALDRHGSEPDAATSTCKYFSTSIPQFVAELSNFGHNKFLIILLFHRHQRQGDGFLATDREERANVRGGVR